MRHMSVNTADLCEMHFSALFEQVRPVMDGLILTTNMATESLERGFHRCRREGCKGQLQLTK